MSQHQVLNNVTHADIKIITEYGQKYGDNISHTIAVISEFRQLQAYYPLFFRKNSQTAKFEPIALLGFADGENLFIDHPQQPGAWQADHIPLTMQRAPFFIGFQNIERDGIPTKTPVVHIDMDSPKVITGSDTGTRPTEPVFLEQGGNTPYLDYISSVLMEIFNSADDAEGLADQLLAYDMLEPFTLKVSFINNTTAELKGFYTINEDMLARLDGFALASFQEIGVLEALYMMLASQNNVQKLIHLKNAQLMRQAANDD